ncbi:MAG: Zn-dependent exopeptidase M28, partial [Oscillospiraceae bacterium]|nr:Zn-dependent exopeptidase M28 [Oscillospiraceae bacterium]
MKRRSRLLSALLALTLLFSLLTLPAGALAPATPTLTPQEAAFLARIDYDNAERMARDITEGIGNRYTATFRRDMTVDYLLSEFTKAGYAPYVHEFVTQNASGVVSSYVNGSLTVFGKKYIFYGPTYNADTVYQATRNVNLSLTGAAVTPWANVGQDLTVPAGTDYAGKAVFVTMEGTSAPNAARYYAAARALQAAGAGAVLFEYFRPRDDGNTSYSRIGNTTLSVTPSESNPNPAPNPPVTIPVGTLLYHETHAVLADLGADTPLTVTMDTSSLGKNVVAVLPSATGSKKNVYVTAHLDSQLSTPGMNDNASGVIMVVELARALRDVPFDYNLVFICFDAEETGLTGARRFCADMTDEDRANFVANYNMDMIATNQDDCIHMFLNISDTRLQALERTLPTNNDRLMDLPAAVAVAQEYEIFNHSYLAALKTGFDMDYFNICYDTTTDHYAFVQEATRAGNDFPNMKNAVEYDWRRNGKGTSFETLYHKTGDTFDINYSRPRNKAVSEIIALALFSLARAYPAVNPNPTVAVAPDSVSRTVSVTGTGYAPGARLTLLGAYDAAPNFVNLDAFQEITADETGAFSVSLPSRAAWQRGQTYYVSVNDLPATASIPTTRIKAHSSARISLRIKGTA